MNKIPEQYKKIGFSKVGEKKKCTSCQGDKWMMLMQDGGDFNVIYGDNTNTTGYLDEAPTNDNPYNIIPTGNITMKGVSKDVLAVKLDSNGQPMGMKFMKPDEDHKFDASSVMEIPKHQEGKEPYVMPEEAKYKGTNISYDTNNPMSLPGAKHQYKINQPFTNIPPVSSGLEGIPASDINNKIQLSQANDMLRPKVTSVGTLTQNLDFQGDTNSDILEKGVQEEVNNIDKNNITNTFDKSTVEGKDQNKQIFNPYGGVDIPTAAYTLGDSIQNKDTMGIIGSSGKLLAGLGRNIVSGLGNANLNQEAMAEYAKKQKEASMGTEVTLQKGGKYEELDYSDVERLNSMSGANFTEEGAKSLFWKEGERSQEEKPKINYGKYGPVKYFDTIQNNGDRVVLTNTDKNPHNRETMQSLLREIKELNPNKKVDFKYTNNFKKGGEFSDSKLLTGEYITGVDQKNKNDMQGVNAEVEAGEYYQTSEGDIAEVIGKKHTQEGEKLTMQNADRVLTDHTKIGSETAKYIKKKYDLDVKAKHTYSDVLDNFKKKIGLNKLVEEEEATIEKLKSQADVKDRTTRDFNEKFLQQKLAEIQEKKNPIEEIRKVIYEELFNIQQSKKEVKSKDNEETPQMRDGGELPKYQDGPKLNETENENPGGQIDKTQSFTNADRRLAGNVTDENYAETMAELMEQFPNLVQELFEIKQGNDGIADFVPRNGLSYEETFNELQNGIQYRYEEVIKNIGESNMSDAEKEKAYETVKAEMFNPNEKSKGYDGKLGNFTSTRKNFKLTDFTTPNTNKTTAEGDNSVDKEQSNYSAYLMPDNYPMPPKGLQGHLKNTRRFDRVNAQQIDPQPFLENLRQQETSAMQSLEGLSPNVAAAAAANITANTQRQANDIINQIENQNLQYRQNAENTNAQTQRIEENARVADNLSYEQRQYTAMAKTDEDLRNYFNNSQAVNKQNFMDIQNLNLTNAMYDDIGFDGQGFYRKTDDNEKIKALEEIVRSKNSKLT